MRSSAAGPWSDRPLESVVCTPVAVGAVVGPGEPPPPARAIAPTTRTTTNPAAPPTIHGRTRRLDGGGPGGTGGRPPGIGTGGAGGAGAPGITGSGDRHGRAAGDGGASRRHQLRARPVSVLRPLSHAGHNDRVERGRQSRADRGRRRRRLGHVRDERGGLDLRREGHAPGQRLEQHRGQRVLVRPRPDRPALDLFRRGVVRCSHEVPGPRDPPRLAGRRSRRRNRLPRLGRPARLAERLAQPEVRQEHPVGALEQDVARLHVAVDEPLRVRLVERARDLAQDVERPGRVEPALPQQHPAEVLALRQPHREEEHPVGLARVVDRQDVRVFQGRGEPRLAQEPLPEVLVVGELRRQDLQRDPAPEVDVFRQIDDALAAAAQHRLDAVVAEERSGSEVGGRHRRRVVSGGQGSGQRAHRDYRGLGGQFEAASDSPTENDLARSCRPSRR